MIGPTSLANRNGPQMRSPIALVLAQLFPLGVVQRSRLAEDRLADADLADVMKDGPVAQDRQFMGPKVERLAQLNGVLHHVPQVLAGRGVLRLDGGSERKDDLLRPLQLLIQRVLLQRLVNGPGEHDRVDRPFREVRPGAHRTPKANLP